MKYKYIKTLPETLSAVKELKNIIANKREIVYLGVDTETYGLYAVSDKIRLLQIAIHDDVYIFDFLFLDKRQELDKFREVLKEFFTKFLKQYKTKVKVGFHNYKFDLQFLWAFGIDLTHIYEQVYCTMLASQLLTAGTPENNSLKDVAYRYLGNKVDKTEQKSDWAIESLSKSQLNYAALDPWYVAKFLPKILIDLDEANLMHLYLNVEMQTVYATASFEYNGIKVDKELLEIAQPIYLERIEEARLGVLKHIPSRFQEEDLFGNILDYGFSVSSPQQVITLLQGLGIPDPLEPEKVVQSTNTKHLALLDAVDYPIIYDLSKFRKIHKLVTSFISGLPDYINPVTERVHTYFNQCVDTGRYCVAKDSLIQIPGGSKPIQDIELGDYVYTYLDSKLTIKKVVNKWYTGKKNTVKVSWKASGNNGNEGYLITTPDHKFKTKDRGWVRADELNKKDKIYSKIEDQVKERKHYSIETNHYVVSVEPYGYIDTYDLEIEDSHNFIANELCVHNSSSNPNLQQLPRPNEDLYTPRKMFIPGEGNVFVGADYGQIELRIIAEILYLQFEDDTQLKEFLEGKDPYVATAALLNGKSYDYYMTLKETDPKKFKSERQSAKAVRLGLNYGMQFKKLRNHSKTDYGVEMTLLQAKKYRQTYMRAYPGLQRYHDFYNDNRIQEVRTLPPYNRRRLFTGEWSGFNALVNHPVQGTSADITKKANARTYFELWENGYSPTQSKDIMMILTVHDENIGECKKDKAEFLKDVIERNMIKSAQEVLQNCPIEAEAKIQLTLADK